MTSKTDREFLQLAAKAAGYDVEFDKPHPVIINNGTGKYWNPLTDDGDALRLAVTLEIELHLYEGNEVDAKYAGRGKTCSEPWGIDGMEATRRAIVRAAAEIGKEIP